MAALVPGAKAVVLRIEASGASGQRLLAMGLYPGCPVKFLRHAPLGDPLMIELPECVICLRWREAQLIEIEEAA